MTITIAEVEQLAILARISLKATEKEQFARQLGAILKYADCLQAVDTEHIEPLIHILPIYNVYREDVVTTSPARDEILANAPLTEDGQYRVPRII